MGEDEEFKKIRKRRLKEQVNRVSEKENK